MPENKHVNNGKCLKCLDIINRYPSFNQVLQSWFVNFQKLHPEGHVAFAGRGKSDQELAFKKGTSRAHYGQSAHNFGLALDVFKLNINGADWGADWYKHTLATAIAMNPLLKWGGNFKSIIDLPHVEIADWEQMVKDGKVKLVE